MCPHGFLSLKLSALPAFAYCLQFPADGYSENGLGVKGCRGFKDPDGSPMQDVGNGRVVW